MRYFVLGADRDEALTWVESKGLHPHSSDVRIITTVPALTGAHFGPDDELVLTGHWWRRTDLRQVIRTIDVSLTKTKSRNHQIERVIRPLIEDWDAQDRRRAERDAVLDSETERLHELHLRRGGTR